jgi:hypothetical protein
MDDSVTRGKLCLIIVAIHLSELQNQSTNIDEGRTGKKGMASKGLSRGLEANGCLNCDLIGFQAYED